MDHLLRPGSAAVRHLEDGALGPAPARVRRPEEIAGGIEDYAGPWVLAVQTAGAEIVQHSLRPAAAAVRRHLEHRAEAVRTAVVGRAVEVAAAIEDEGGVGILPIRTADTEVVEHPLGPAPVPVR